MRFPNAPEAPPWALALIERDPNQGWRDVGAGTWIRRLQGPDFTLVSARREDAVTLDEHAFKDATTDAYETLQRELDPDGRQPVRVWNFVPGILEPLGSMRHRYMAFNAGRYEAYERRFGAGSSFERLVPTASGVGHPGRDLVVHFLATAAPGRPVENPRQTPSYTYSSRYGPRPPCFARATSLENGDRRWLLVGGTASVVGEDSTHCESLEAQFDETLENLQALVSAAWPTAGMETQAPTSARIYFVRREDEAFLREITPRRLEAGQAEFIEAQLCRPDLLVEIEALYELPARNQTAAA